MNAALIILKPRQIAATEQALDELPTWLPIIELVGYTERQLADGIFAQALELHPHDYYLVASDDVIVRMPALLAVHNQLRPDQAVTGYCQFTHTDWRVNVTRRPLRGDTPSQSSYDFLSFHELVAGPPLRQTWFTGMALTGMSAAMWARFPFGCFVDTADDKGYASDFHLSRRLQAAGVRVDVVREGFVYHLRHEQRHTNDPRDDRVIVGEVTPEIRLR